MPRPPGAALEKPDHELGKWPKFSASAALADSSALQPRVTARHLLLLLAAILATACATRPRAPEQPDYTGVASWYGQEFAGRTTANGEIFDPRKLTAAHRTLPFGTIVEVRNLENDRRVEVRINDRGPFIGGRIIDLSFAAAQRIDLVERGVGDVALRIVRVGAGPLEPPEPVIVRSAPPPDVPFPLPGETERTPRPADSQREEAVVDRIRVEEIRDGTPVRRQVSQDGSRIEAVPMDDGRGIPTPSRSADVPPAPPAQPRAAPSPPLRWDLQLGAFGSEENARILAERIRPAAPAVRIERYRELYRVRVGPFPTREAAIEARERLDAAGFESLVVPASGG